MPDGIMIRMVSGTEEVWRISIRVLEISRKGQDMLR